MVASPVMTTPRLSSRSASSSRLSSLSPPGPSSWWLRLAGCESTEAIRRPGAGEQDAVAERLPALLLGLDELQELLVFGALDKHAGAQQRTLHGIGRQRFDVHRVADGVKLAFDRLDGFDIEPAQLVALELRELSTQQVRSARARGGDLRLQ